MINNPIIFYLASAIIILFGVLFIFQKNIINSLLSSIMVFLSAAIFFYILGSEYNAIIQAIVYGIAVPVIIGISVMFTTGKGECRSTGTVPYLVILSSGIFILALFYIIKMSFVMTPSVFNLAEPAAINSFDILSSFAHGIFVKYVFAFEMVSILLTIIIAGLTIIGRRRV